MRWNKSIRILLLYPAALCLSGFSACAQDIPMEARFDLDYKLSALSDVVFHERIERTVKAGGLEHGVDEVVADVEVVSGVERYSNIRRKGKAVRDMHSIPGAWSAGELSSILKLTRNWLDDSHASEVSTDEIDGVTVDVLESDVPAEQHAWMVTVDMRILWLPVHAQVYVSRRTGEVVRLEWTSGKPEHTGIDHLAMTVDYRESEVSGRRLPLPVRSVYSVIHDRAGLRAEVNSTSFTPAGSTLR